MSESESGAVSHHSCCGNVTRFFFFESFTKLLLYILDIHTHPVLWVVSLIPFVSPSLRIDYHCNTHSKPACIARGGVCAEARANDENHATQFRNYSSRIAGLKKFKKCSKHEDL